MLLKNFALRVFSVLFLITILLLGVLLVPVQAKSSIRPLQAGGDFLWAAAMTSADTAINTDTAVDSSGNVYITGYFSGTTDFDPGAGVFNLTSTGLNDGFISKLDNNGNFIWAKSMGGTDDEQALGIALDSNGNVYTTGYFNTTADFDPSPATFNLTSSAAADMFIVKLDVDGNFIWAQQIGGANAQAAYDITVDTSGNVYTTGAMSGTTDFDPGPATVSLAPFAGGFDIFVSKLDTNGNYVWAKHVTQNGASMSYGAGYGIAVDSNSNVYTTGYLFGTMDFDPNAGTANMTSVGPNGSDIFVLKLDGNGNYIWAKSAGSSDGSAFFEFGNSIAIDPGGNAYIFGQFKNIVDFDPGAGVYNLGSASVINAVIWKLDGSGNLVWAKNLTTHLGTGNVITDSNNNIGTVMLDANSNIYLTGGFSGTVDFDPDAGITNLTSAGTSMFISKLDANSGFIWAKQSGSYAQGVGSGLDASGYLYTTGLFHGTVDFDPGAGTSNLTSPGSANNIFFLKLEKDAIPPTPTETATSTTTSTATETPIATVTPTETVTATVTESPTVTMTATVTETATGTFTPSPTVTQTATPSAVTISLPSNALQDGWILESGENSNTGGSINNSASTLNLGDDASKKQYRSILSFNTGSLPDTAVITSITLKLKQQSILGGGNPIKTFKGLLLDIKNGFFGSTATLQTIDFQAAASKTYGPFSPALTGGFYSINLSSGKAFINKLAAKSGLTQIRLRFKLDDNNNTLANILSLYSGNAATATNRPQLVVTYYVP